MNKEKFVGNYLEKLLVDQDIRKYLSRAQTDREREMLKENLKLSLERSYDTYAKEYFDSKGVGSYLSTFLRGTGAVTDAIGSYMFWAMGGAGFGVKSIGVLEKSVADLIDSYHYARHAKGSLTEKLSDEAKAVSEGLVERTAAYLSPIAVGEIADLLRGTSKFDNKVTGRAVQYAKKGFIDYLTRIEEKEPYMVSLDKFKNPAYASSSIEDKAMAA